MNFIRELIITILACAIIAAIGGYSLAGGTEAIVAIDMADQKAIAHYMAVETQAVLVTRSPHISRSFSIRCRHSGLQFAGIWGYSSPRQTKSGGLIADIALCFGRRAMERAAPVVAPTLCELSGRDLVGIRDDVITCGPMGLHSA